MFKQRASIRYRSFKPSNGAFRPARNHGPVRSSRGGYRQIRSLPNDPLLFTKKATWQETPDYVPQNSFNDFNLVQPLKTNILNKGYSSPTPIQDQAIPAVLEGRDIIGLASTGSGKTAAFLIPLINKIYLDRSQKALIIVPTRELAAQIKDEFRSFTEGMNLYSTLIIGGADMKRQIQDLKHSPQVLIATPGRLKDLIERRVIYLSDYKNIVLDEVDLMVDIGFINDIKYFISLMLPQKQSLFFSATIPIKVEGILKMFVKNPVAISVKKQDTSENIEQDVVKVEHSEKKIEKLHDLLISDGFDKVLIFGRTKHGIENLNKQLMNRGFKVGAIHGDKRQSQRQRALQSFKQNEIQILLATDVASRGLDIPNVTHVINYELPETYEDYIHRIGRTGRANKKGFALTFI